MDFKIGTKIGVEKSSEEKSLQFKVRGEGAKLRPSLRTTSQGSQPKDQDATKLSVSNLRNYVGTAKNAVDSIADLRTKQLELAKEAASSPQGARTEVLNEEAQTLQTEIERVRNSATFNNVNVLSESRTLTAKVGTGDNAKEVAVSVATSAVIASDPQVSLSSQDEADSAVSQLNGSLFAASNLGSSLISAEKKADDITDVKETGSPEDEPVRSEDKAREISEQIAMKLGSPLNSLEEVKNLIDASAGNLDPERVGSLLREA